MCLFACVHYVSTCCVCPCLCECVCVCMCVCVCVCVCVYKSYNILTLHSGHDQLEHITRHAPHCSAPIQMTTTNLIHEFKVILHYKKPLFELDPSTMRQILQVPTTKQLLKYYVLGNNMIHYGHHRHQQFT